ncbi:MAG: Mu transposase C-terminal domain-containing protein [Culturomica sp.]|jgi:putative transposase|nr:Mu transposase C-terminal domain-containing protein [Culturomica sp.]
MRVDEYNRILIGYEEVVPVVFKKGTYDIALHRQSIITTCRGGCGREVEIIYDECSPSYQTKIRAVLGDPREMLGLVKKGEPVLPLSELSDREFSICQARYTLVNSYRDYAAEHKARAKGTVNAKQEFVDLVNSGLLCDAAYAVTGDVSFKTLERWSKRLRDFGEEMNALVPERKRSNATSTTLSAAEQELLIKIIRNHYCQPVQPTLADSLRIVEAVFKSFHMPVPGEAKCRRFMRRWIEQNGALVEAARRGVKAMKDKFMPYVERDPESIRFLDVLVADGHVMNFQVEYTVPDKSGREVTRTGRPTMIAWQDMRTGAIMGFELMMTENTLCVASSFRLACMQAARMCGSTQSAVLPRMVYLDNGKAFKNKFFNETVNLKNSVGGLFEQLKAHGFEGVQYALPYNAQTKTIERSWRNFLEVEKQAVYYTGNCIDNKPAYLQRNETWHREALQNEISKKGMLTLPGAYAMIARWVEEYNAREGSGKYLAGSSPAGLAAQQLPDVDLRGRILPADTLNYMIMQRRTCTIKRNGVQVNGAWYYNAAEMALLPKNEIDVIVKYDMFNPDKVYVFRTDGTYWCEAGYFIGQKVHAMYKLGSESQQRAAKAAIGTVERIIHTASNMAKNLKNGGQVLDYRIGELDVAPAVRQLGTTPQVDDGLDDIRMY